MQPNNSLNTSDATLHAVDYLQILKNRYGIILLTFILVILTAAVITYVMPKKYEATAVVKINPLGTKNQVVGNRASALMTRQFFGTQFKIIESDENLKRAAEMTQLPQKMQITTAQAVRVLKGGLSTKQERGTDLIEISLRMVKDNIEHIKPLTEAVALAYSEMRIAQETQRREQTRVELDKKIQKYEDIVEDYRTRLLEFSNKTGIYSLDRYSGGSTAVVSRDLQQENMLYDEAVKARDELELQVKNLVGLDDETLISHVSGLNRPESAVLAVTFQQYQEAKRERAGALAQGLGENHPQVKLHDSQISILREDLDAKVLRVRDLLKVLLDQAGAKVARLEVSRGASKDDAKNTAQDYTLFKTYEDEYKDSVNNLNTLRTSNVIEELQENMSIKPLEFYAFPTEPEVADYVSPKWILNMALGSLAGLIFGVGIAFSLELMDTSVKSVEDVERYLQVPVLAVVPRDVGVLHQMSASSPDAEAYRILRTNIEFNRPSQDANAITIVSGGAGEGKSTTLVNLAYICAQGGYSTLMIDADLRRPRLHTFFDINNTVGLTNYLATALPLEDVVLQTSIENLYFMPSGVLPADAAGILNSRRMSELIQEVKSRFDLVLVDSPPILGVSDASVISSEVDLTLIVVQHRKLPRNMLVRVRQAVENVGGRVLGVALNNVDLRSDSQYQYYTSYYTYYAPDQNETTTAEPKSKVSADSQKSSDLY
ncbi:MAG: polysaccharide biosynthesis tyrosine autokinase [Rubritalea sp.]|uniref:polysaccharide biosynthesis tyrosine autokinase n=1 Tax=Rubritalea sp. TaxID=2109375 RepID=UPI003241D136